ncbi:MAG: single-stranded-DNA-specific exonuclease RecJ [Planctomycetaceae bacterium]|nr:single-stranded-DNA-specific exonuclease RecJ [Planctomycetaceae bacterium]
MQKRWKILPFDPDRVEQLEAAAQIPTVVAQLLLNRGIDHAEEISAFLETKLSGLRPPEELPGIPEAASLIYKAVKEGKKILIYGDYDADGMTASAILYRCLTILHAEVAYFAPNRISDGYGLNTAQIRRHHDQGFELIISVDCGIANAEEIDVAKELGMQVVVTDHHEFAERLPEADVIVHPRLPGTDYSFGGLCGAAVALKLAWSLCQLDSEATRVKPAHRDFLMMAVGIAAIGTVADVVPLQDENRIIVTHGLRSLKNRPPLGLAALMKLTGLSGKQQFDAQDIGFNIGPRLNAAGRLGQAPLGVELLVTNDEKRAHELAEYLDNLNNDRKKIERSINLAAVKQIKEKYDVENDPSFVLAGHGWNAGVIGVVSGRLAEKYARPVILIALDQMGVKPGIGSARNGGIGNLHETLQHCTAHLIKHGGHAAAAGLTIEENQIDAFRSAFCEYIQESITAEDRIAEVVIDAEASLSQLTPQTIFQMQQLGPFGEGNPAPVLCASNVDVVTGSAKRMGGGELHLSVKVSQHGKTLRAVAFGQGDWAEELDQVQGQIDVVFKPVINEFRGQRNVELHLEDWRPVAEST